MASRFFQLQWTVSLVFFVVGAPVMASKGDSLSDWRVEEVARFAADEARQGVAVDSDYLYVIGNREVGKYDKHTFEKMASWSSPKDGPVIHLNAGLVHEGELVMAHSNYPGVPMQSSVERFDPKALQPIGSHSFGIYFGSLTWVDRRGEGWIACFAHYSNRAAEPNRDPTWTSLVWFDSQWRRMGGWAFPKALFEHIGGDYTLSGGAMGPGEFLYVTGHDDRELHVLRFPKMGSVMEWVGTVEIPFEGQAFAWDPSDLGVFYGIRKKAREVVVCRLHRVR